MRHPSVLVAALCVCVLIVRVAWAWFPDANSGKARFDRRIAQLLQSDPNPGIDSNIAQELIARPTIVVYAAKCACNHELLEAIEKASNSKADVKLMMPVSGSADAILKIFEKHKSKILIDSDKVVGNRLNMAFVPRVFIVDAEGKLIWLYPHYEESWQVLMDQAVKQLEAIQS